MTVPCISIKIYISDYFHFFLRCFSLSYSESYMPELTIRLVHLFLLIIFVAGIFFIAPAILFDYLEPRWNFLDAIYFTFISLTTVGLGDFVPGFNHEATYISQRAFYQIATSGNGKELINNI